jgi:signal transduction histidine kinase
MYRALALLRVVVLAHSIVVNALRWDSLARPGLAAASLGVMAGWTAFTAWAYSSPARRGPLLLGADLLVTIAAMLVTPAILGMSELRDTGTLPAFWVMTAVLAWGIHWHWVGGLVAATVVSLADIGIRADLDQTNVGNIFLLMIGGPVVGYLTGLLQEMATARDRAERSAAVAAERARLARVVHDGVLQVLSLVQRRGLQLGGEAAELGRLAGEQEVALRALVRQGEPSSFASSGDLAQALTLLESARVTVSTPGVPVLLPAGLVEELTAVVRACLDNVSRHVGPDAPAWVLLEDLGASVVITVRDSGPGIAPGRLKAAAVEGRLGVSASIRGRMLDLGGTATLVTAPGQGTEWELALPRPR